jgi:hypothetical protein
MAAVPKAPNWYGDQAVADLSLASETPQWLRHQNLCRLEFSMMSLQWQQLPMLQFGCDGDQAVAINEATKWNIQFHC